MTELNVKTITQLLSVSTRDKPNDDHEKMQFYYHLDHLGSSSYITNLDGEVSQHIEYVPFGEVFIDELELMRKSATAGKANYNNTWNTPYRFNDCANEGSGKLACSMPSAANRRVELNAKEFDEETGLYYYGSRYYNPRFSFWLSTDPIEEKYPNITSYCYVASNPVKFIDPDGNDIVISGKENTSITLTTDLIDIKVNAASLGINWGGNYTLQGEAVLSATLDIVGIFDPSGAADALNATLQAKNNEWLDAGISLAGIIPYVGDIAKAGKIKKDVKIIETAIDACKQGHKKAKVVHGNSKASTKAQHVYEIFDKETGKAVKTGISSGKKTKAGKSYRANSQVNRWNRQAG